MKSFSAPAAIAALLAFGSAGAAPGDAPILRNNQITESALIDSLGVAPPPPPGGLTRGFKPSVGGSTAAAPAAKPAAPGRANLLIIFDTASATLTGESKSALDTVAKALQSDTLAGLTFRIEGHADARGDPEANRRLSQLRAEAVVEYLVSRHGILPDRLTAKGKGDTEPLNKTQVDAPENRRVTFITNRS